MPRSSLEQDQDWNSSLLCLNSPLAFILCYFATGIQFQRSLSVSSIKDKSFRQLRKWKANKSMTDT